jgi:hypothetical protein
MELSLEVEVVLLDIVVIDLIRCSACDASMTASARYSICEDCDALISLVVLGVDRCQMAKNQIEPFNNRKNRNYPGPKLGGIGALVPAKRWETL